MNCLQAEEHFSAHFEDTLDYQTLQDFEAHLTECEACQHEYVRFQRVCEGGTTIAANRTLALLYVNATATTPHRRTRSEQP